MKITEMKARNRGREVRILVSEMVKNQYCDDDRPRWGWWYCVKGGEVGYFVTRRPYSGVVLEGKLQESERDIFTVNSRIDTKEQFETLVGNLFY